MFTVVGMTCEHCVRAVTAGVSRLPGVRSVDVDLSSGTMTVAAEGALRESDVAAAVEEAGYGLVPEPRDQPR